MAVKTVKRTIKFRVTYDEDRITNADIKRLVDDIVKDRDWPIPFSISAGSYRIERVWR